MSGQFNDSNQISFFLTVIANMFCVLCFDETKKHLDSRQMFCVYDVCQDFQMNLSQ